MTHLKRGSWLTVLAAIALPRFALTAETPAAAATADKLEEIVVTASRRAESAFRMPYAIDTRGMSELQETLQVRTVPDALRNLPGIMIQKTSHGQGSPFIRGFTGLRTLLLIDGIRLNNSVLREGPNQYWNTVDPLSAWRLEVVKGPTSVLYGSDAIGGTVNAISRSSRDVGEMPGFRSRWYGRAASAEHSLVLRPEIGYVGNRFDITAAGSFKNFGDLRGGPDIRDMPKTGYDESDADLKVNYDLTANQRLVAALQYVNQDDAWRTHSTVFGRSWEGTTVGDDLRRSLDQTRTLAYLQYRASDLTPWMQALRLSVSHHRQEEQQVRIRDDRRMDLSGFDAGTTGLVAQMVVASPVGTWTGGTELYHDAVDSFQYDYNADGTLRRIAIQGPIADDATYDTAAAFLQDQIAFGDRTDLIVGLRYSRSNVDADAVQHPSTGERTSISDHWSATTASVRLSRRLDAAGRHIVFGGISQGFRAPNLSDLTRLGSGGTGEIVTPVLALDPEKYLSYEIGTKYAGERWNGEAAVYYMTIDGMVTTTPTGAVFDGDLEITKLNSGAGYVTGLELQGELRMNDEWSLFGNFTWMDGKLDAFPTSAPVPVREPLDRLMPLTLNAGARWSPHDAGWWIEAFVTRVVRQDKLSTRDMSDTDRIPPGGTPGYTVLTLRSGWPLSQGLNLSVALENLTDEDYRVHGSGVNEPGRNVVVSLIWQH